MTGMLMQTGLGWVPDPQAGPNQVRTATPGELADEIFRLFDLLQGAKNLIAHLIDKSNANEADAERWRGLMASQRIRVMGSAGFGHTSRPPDPNGYRHMGVEFWSIHKTEPEFQDLVAHENTHARKVFDDYIDVVKGLAP